MLKKATTIKRFEYFPLGKELKAQTGIAKKQYQRLDKTYEFDETINKKLTLKKYNQSGLIYNSKYSLHKYYRGEEKVLKLSLESKHSFLAEFIEDFDKFSKLKTKRKNKKDVNDKKNVNDTSSGLYNNLLETYFDEYYDLSDAKRSKIDPKYDHANSTLDEYDYEWYKEK